MSAELGRHLYVVLDAASRDRAASSAKLPVLKCDHVTLARAVPLDSEIAAYLDGDRQEGDVLTLRVVAEYLSEHVQAWLVELAGSSFRRYDGGRLHLTVSRSHAARSRDSNALIRTGTPTPREDVLHGTLQWVAQNPEASPRT